LQAIETELQPYVANLFLARTLLESIVPAFCGLFIGSWSDHYGRKPLLIVSMIGETCFINFYLIVLTNDCCTINSAEKRKHNRASLICNHFYSFFIYTKV